MATPTYDKVALDLSAIIQIYLPGLDVNIAHIGFPKNLYRTTRKFIRSREPKELIPNVSTVRECEFAAQLRCILLGDVFADPVEVFVPDKNLFRRHSPAALAIKAQGLDNIDGCRTKRDCSTKLLIPSVALDDGDIVFLTEDSCSQQAGNAAANDCNVQFASHDVGELPIEDELASQSKY